MKQMGLRNVDLEKTSDKMAVTLMEVLAEYPGLGSKMCHLQLAGRSTMQRVFFIQGVERLFLSVETCKVLGLVHRNFPHHTQSQSETREVNSVQRQRSGNSLPDRPTRMSFAPT